MLRVLFGIFSFAFIARLFSGSRLHFQAMVFVSMHAQCDMVRYGA